MPKCCSRSKVASYADDTTITSCTFSERSKILSDAITVKEWFDYNCLTLNKKCTVILFGEKKIIRQKSHERSN